MGIAGEFEFIKICRRSRQSLKGLTLMLSILVKELLSVKQLRRYCASPNGFVPPLVHQPHAPTVRPSMKAMYIIHVEGYVPILTLIKLQVTTLCLFYGRALVKGSAGLRCEQNDQCLGDCAACVSGDLSY